jgi:hypothetical protein
MYLYAALGSQEGGDDLRVRTMNVKGGPPVGIIIRLLRHELVLSMNDGVPVTDEHHLGKTRLFRPGILSFANERTGSTVVLWLSWQDERYHPSVEAAWNADAS